MQTKHLGWMLLALVSLVSCNQRPRSNSVFYMNINTEPSGLNPAKSTDGAASSVQGYIVETLLGRNINTWEFTPKLAVKWKISDDKTKFTFWLRENVKWHDGVLFTAEDVEFSFTNTFNVKRWKNADKQQIYENIKSVKAVGKFKVEVEVKEAIYSNFDLIVEELSIIPKHFYDKKEKKSYFNKHLIGTGPYKLEKWHRGNRIVLVKNKDWWGKDDDYFQGKFNFPKMVLRWVADSTVSIEMLKKGKLDFQGMRAEDYQKKTKGPMWGKSVHRVKMKNNSPKSYCFIGMNFKDPILKNRNIRKALFHLLNRKLMIQKFENSMSVPAIGPIFPKSPYASIDLKPVKFNPKKALAMLKKEGWKDSNGDGLLDKNGKKMSFTILEPGSAYVKYHTIFKEDARKVGVEILIKQIEWNSFLKLVTQDKNFQMCRLCWGATSLDWDPKQIWHSDSIISGSNFISYKNKIVDKNTDLAIKEFDRSKRIELLRKVEKEIVNDVPYLFYTFQDSSFYGHSDRVLKEKDTFKYGAGVSSWKFKESKKE